jgi:cellobiose transport system permease protein
MVTRLGMESGRAAPSDEAAETSAGGLPMPRQAGRARGASRDRRRSRLYWFDVKASPYAYIAPFFLLFLGFGIFPVVFTAWVSLHDWPMLGGGHPFLGLGNYRELLADENFHKALFNTLSIGVLSTVPQLLLALLVAHLINARLRLGTLFQIGLVLPNITSVAAVAVIFSQLFARDFGLINWVLGQLGVGTIDWQAGTASSHVALSVMITWRWAGYNALLYLAAMQAVPRELYEAATIDGASAFRQLRSITVPMIRPTIIFTVIVSTVGAMQIIAEPLLFSGDGLPTGGADRQFQTLALYLYEQGFNRLELGYASAVAWVMFVLVVIAAGVNYLFVRRIRDV